MELFPLKNLEYAMYFLGKHSLHNHGLSPFRMTMVVTTIHFICVSPNLEFIDAIKNMVEPLRGNHCHGHHLFHMIFPKPSSSSYTRGHINMCVDINLTQIYIDINIQFLRCYLVKTCTKMERRGHRKMLRVLVL